MGVDSLTLILVFMTLSIIGYGYNECIIIVRLMFNYEKYITNTNNTNSFLSSRGI